MKNPNIAEFYQDKSILITGATGFMGKVLVEKLLRSCPGIDRVYLLLRPSKGKDVTSRLQELINNEVWIYTFGFRLCPRIIYTYEAMTVHWRKDIIFILGVSIVATKSTRSLWKIDSRVWRYFAKRTWLITIWPGNIKFVGFHCLSHGCAHHLWRQSPSSHRCKYQRSAKSDYILQPIEKITGW